MGLLIISLMLIFIFSFSAQATELRTYIISFPDDPLQIREAKVQKFRAEQPSSKVECKLLVVANQKAVKAVRFYFLFYDFFDEYLDRFDGIVIGEIPIRIDMVYGGKL